MGRTSELSMTLDEMTSCGKNLVEAARELYSCGELLVRLSSQIREEFTDTAAGEQPASGDQAQAASDAAAAANQAEDRMEATMPEPVPAEHAAPTYTKEQVRAILAKKSREDNGRYKDAVRSIVRKYGSGSLTSVEVTDYAAVIAEAEALGHAD